MKIKVSEAKDQVLDYLVAKCEGRGFVFGETDYTDGHTYQRGTAQATGPHCSTDWSQGGPIIEREWVDLHCVNDSLWEAECPAPGGLAMQNGPTPLIAAMRCYVASKLGDDINIPEEFL